MKATKKIVGAACALVAAVALSAGSTFAWFSQSGKVTATGMFVKAKTTEALVISNSNEDTAEWGVKAESSNTTVKELTPTSTVDGENFYNVVEEELEKVEYQSGNASDDTTFEKSVNSSTVNYFVTHTYYIKAVAAADATEPVTYASLYVSAITVEKKGGGDIEEKISNAIRVAVKWGENGTTYLYDPAGNGNRDGLGINAAGAYSASTGAVVFSKVGIESPGVDITGAESVSSTEATAVTITVWYEGQDEDCTSFKALNAEELVISVDFAAAKS